MKRRDFLSGLAGLGAAGLAGAGDLLAQGPGNRSSFPRGLSPREATGRLSARSKLPERWGVQLYTVRDRMAGDVRGTLEAVAGMGYGEVEFAGLFDWTPEQMRSLLDDLDLQAASSHVGMNVIRGEWASALDAAEILGQDLIVLPSLPGDARTADGLRALADELNRAGEVARKRGLHLGFHNHGFEVTPLGSDAGGDGTPASRPLDILLAHTDPAFVSFQLDLFWTVDGGADPLAYFDAHPGRFLSVHVKDRTPEGRMVDVGSGTMDFRALLTVGEAAGMRHAFVEHDRPEDSMTSIRNSIRHLRGLGGGSGSGASPR